MAIPRPVCALVGGFLFLAGALGVPARVGAGEPARRGLLIGVAGYERPGTDGWWELHTEHDIDAVHRLLVRKFGFAEADLRVLHTREETTRDGILGAFRELIDATQPGDVVFFHYSGHGSEIPDDNGDELDGRDECLVPSDYVSKTDASKNIRDDVLAGLLEELAARKPSSVTFVFDCCFSGTATRAGRLTVRGQSWMGPRPAVSRSGARGPEPGGGLAATGHPAAQGYVVLSATSQGQVAAEVQDQESGEVMGLLTWAFVQAAAGADKETTYRDLYERVLGIMGRESHEQTPQLEGPMDRVLFGGKTVPPRTYIPLTVDKSGKVYLEAGSLQGMTKGSRLRLFAAGTKDFRGTPPLAEAVIEGLDLNYATLALEPADADPESLDAGRAVEITHAYGDNRLRVRVEGLGSAAAPLGAVSSLAVLETGTGAGEAWDLRLRRAGERVVVERPDGSVVDSLDAGSGLPEAVKLCVEGEARWRFLNALTSDDPGASVRVELRVVPVEPVRDAAGRVTGVGAERTLTRDASGGLMIDAGQHVVLELRNPGYVPAYVTVLDLRPDGRVGPLWPYPGLRVQDNRIPPDGAWHRVGFPFIFRIEDPGHAEVFKALATAQPADFSPLLDRRVLTERGGAEDPLRQSPLGRVLAALTLGERCDASAVAVGDWATSEVRFQVVPAP